MMNRFLGKAKAKEPTPTLDDAQGNMAKRDEYLQTKITKLDAELLGFKKQLARMKPGSAKNALQQRAIRVLKQKKMYEKQRDSLGQQSYNIDQTRLAQENLKDMHSTLGAMKEAHVQLKKEFKKVDLNEVEDLHDDMSDLLEQNEEIQEILGREYGVPEEIDEADLEGELAALEELDALEDDLLADEVPSIKVSGAAGKKEVEAAPQVEDGLDEFGLPKAPAKLNA